jgi:exodeoxyribonuclease VII small subunit
MENENMTFEEAIKRLEDIVKELESGKAPLEKSLSLFEEGIELSKFCDSLLKNIEKKAMQILENGELKTFEVEQ